MSQVLGQRIIIRLADIFHTWMALSFIGPIKGVMKIHQWFGQINGVAGVSYGLLQDVKNVLIATDIVSILCWVG